MSDIKSKFGENLKRIRNKRELSQEQLAFQVDISREYVSRIERGKRNISLDLVGKLAEILEVKPKDFFN